MQRRGGDEQRQREKHSGLGLAGHGEIDGERGRSSELGSLAEETRPESSGVGGWVDVGSATREPRAWFGAKSPARDDGRELPTVVRCRDRRRAELELIDGNSCNEGESWSLGNPNLQKKTYVIRKLLL